MKGLILGRMDRVCACYSGTTDYTPAGGRRTAVRHPFSSFSTFSSVYRSASSLHFLAARLYQFYTCCPTILQRCIKNGNDPSWITAITNSSTLFYFFLSEISFFLMPASYFFFFFFFCLPAAVPALGRSLAYLLFWYSASSHPNSLNLTIQDSAARAYVSSDTCIETILFTDINYT